jgi:hypothetical protein
MAHLPSFSKMSIGVLATPSWVHKFESYLESDGHCYDDVEFLALRINAILHNMDFAGSVLDDATEHFQRKELSDVCFVPEDGSKRMLAKNMRGFSSLHSFEMDGMTFSVNVVFGSGKDVEYETTVNMSGAQKQFDTGKPVFPVGVRVAIQSQNDGVDFLTENELNSITLPLNEFERSTRKAPFSTTGDQNFYERNFTTFYPPTPSNGGDMTDDAPPTLDEATFSLKVGDIRTDIAVAGELPLDGEVQHVFLLPHIESREWQPVTRSPQNPPYVVPEELWTRIHDEVGKKFILKNKDGFVLQDMVRRWQASDNIGGGDEDYQQYQIETMLDSYWLTAERTPRLYLFRDKDTPELVWNRIARSMNIGSLIMGLVAEKLGAEDQGDNSDFRVLMQVSEDQVSEDQVIEEHTPTGLFSWQKTWGKSPKMWKLSFPFPVEEMLKHINTLLTTPLARHLAQCIQHHRYNKRIMAYEGKKQVLRHIETDDKKNVLLPADLRKAILDIVRENTDRGRYDR